MSNHPSWSCPVDTDVLLILAWFTRLDLRALLQRKKREQHWKLSPQLLEEMLQTSLEDALTCLQGEPLYGPAWLSLARYRISRVDLQRVTWAIALEELADPSNGVFFSDDPYRSAGAEDQQKNGPADETEALLSAVKLHTPLTERLHSVSQTWANDVCLGASQLRALFTWNLEIVQGCLRVPLFLLELLRTGLERVNWHTLAAQVLRVTPPGPCDCMARPAQDVALTPADGEWLRESHADVIATIPGPEHLLQRAVDTISAMLMNLADAEGHQHPESGEIYSDVVQGASFLAEALKAGVIPDNYETDGVAGLIDQVISQVTGEQWAMTYERETGGE